MAKVIIDLDLLKEELEDTEANLDGYVEMHVSDLIDLLWAFGVSV